MSGSFIALLDQISERKDEELSEESTGLKKEVLKANERGMKFERKVNDSLVVTEYDKTGKFVESTLIDLEEPIKKASDVARFFVDKLPESSGIGIPPENIKYLENVKTLVLDCAMWFDRSILGHYNVSEAFALIKELNPQTVFLTQAGHTFPPHLEAEKEINEKWEKEKGDCESKIYLAYDGLEYDPEKEFITKAISADTSEELNKPA